MTPDGAHQVSDHQKLDVQLRLHPAIVGTEVIEQQDRAGLCRPSSRSARRNSGTALLSSHRQSAWHPAFLDNAFCTDVGRGFASGLFEERDTDRPPYKECFRPARRTTPFSSPSQDQSEHDIFEECRGRGHRPAAWFFGAISVLCLLAWKIAGMRYPHALFKS